MVEETNICIFQKHKIRLSGQFYSQKYMKTGIAQGSYLSPLFLIFLNDLPNTFQFQTKLFHYLFLLSAVNNTATSTDHLNLNPLKICK